MAQTVIAFGDPKAQKKWSGSLFLEVKKKSYFDKKFVGDSEDHIIQRLTDLESDAGDTMSFDLVVRLRKSPTYGDNRLQGKEEQLRFFTDSLSIDQMRHAVSAGGKMSRKRTIHNLRRIARTKLSDYWAQFNDEMNFVYLSGSRGINEDFIESIAWAGHAGNAIQAPDAAHLSYGGTATAKNNVATTDKMTKAVIEKAAVKARMLGSTDPNLTSLQPVMVDGEEHFVCIMSEFQAFDLRTADTTGWLDIQKAATAAEGKNNPIFKGGLGMIDDVVLHKHKNVIRFGDYGAGSNVKAARALFLGAQAGAIAYGSAEGSGTRYTWSEETADHGNEPQIAAGMINGVKKTRFNGSDFGVIAIDTASADPNA